MYSTMKGRVVAAIAGVMVLGVGVLGVELPPISVDPMVAWVELEAGGEHVGNFTVTNMGDDPIALDIGLFDFVLGDTGGFVWLVPGTLGPRSLADHVTFSPEQVTLDAGEVRTVTYRFTLPTDAEGPHWAALIVAPQAADQLVVESEDAQGLGFRVRLEVAYAFAIIQRPPDRPGPLGQVVGLDVRGATEEGGTRQIKVDLAFQNMVDDVVRCTTYFEVRGADGTTLARHEAPRAQVVLPGAVRVFTHTFQGLDMPPGEYLVLGVVDFGGERLSAGQHRVTVSD